MIRLLHAYFPARTLVLGLTEAALATVAFLIATIAQLGMLNGSIVLDYERGYAKIALLTGIFVVCMYYFDLYDSSVLSNQRESFTRTIQSLGFLCIVFGFIYYVFPSTRLERGTFVYGWLLALAAVLMWRKGFYYINRSGFFSERCVVVGDGPAARLLVSEMTNRPEIGLRVIGCVSEDVPGTNSEDASDWVAEQLEEITSKQRVERIVVALGERRGRLPVEELLRLKTLGITIQDGAELYETVSGKIAPNSLRLSWLLFSPGFQPSRRLQLYKRCFSILLSIVGIILASPFMALAALAIRNTSPGPVIFRQKRIGQNGRTFTLYKFRSMVDSADQARPALKDDERVTTVGRWLRRTRLDELPQLFNILKGDMAFVGPRPFVPEQEAECVREIPFYKQRWTVKPGATGWAQVNRPYCATLEDNADKLAYDLFYIKNISLGLDLLIFLHTIKILFLGRGSR